MSSLFAPNDVILGDVFHSDTCRLCLVDHPVQGDIARCPNIAMGAVLKLHGGQARPIGVFCFGVDCWIQPLCLGFDYMRCVSYVTGDIVCPSPSKSHIYSIKKP